MTDGGGGTFANIWTPSTFAQAGMYISNTSTEGRVYELSSEHHVRNEVKLKNASNWQIYALQTEEERGEGPFALPLSIDNSSNITVANYHSYRVVSSYQPFLTAIQVSNSKNIRFRNIFICHGDNKVSFDNDPSSLISQPLCWFATVSLRHLLSKDSSSRAASSSFHCPCCRSKGGELCDGFYNISGATVDKTGRLYFVDAHWQRIYRWAPESHELSIVRDSPLAPVQLTFDKAGNLIVVSYDGNGTISTFFADSPDEEITLLKPQPAKRGHHDCRLPVTIAKSRMTSSKPFPRKGLTNTYRPTALPSFQLVRTLSQEPSTMAPR